MPRTANLSIFGVVLCAVGIAALAVSSGRVGDEDEALTRQFEVRVTRSGVGTPVPPHSITIFSPDNWKDDPTWRIEATYGRYPAIVFLGELPRDSVERIAETIRDRSLLRFDRLIREDHWCADQLEAVFSHYDGYSFFGRHRTPNIVALPDTLNVRYLSLTRECGHDDHEEPPLLHFVIEDVFRLARRYALQRISPMDDKATPPVGFALFVTDSRHFSTRIRSATGRIDLVEPTTFGGPVNRLGTDGYRLAYYVFPRDPAGRTLFELSDGRTLHVDETRLTQGSIDGSEHLLLGPAPMGMLFALSDNEQYLLASTGSASSGFIYYRLELDSGSTVQILEVPFIDDARINSDGTVDFEINGELYRWSDTS